MPHVLQNGRGKYASHPYFPQEWAWHVATICVGVAIMSSLCFFGMGVVCGYRPSILLNGRGVHTSYPLNAQQ